MRGFSVDYVRLADRRRLAYYEFGDPQGVPCVFTAGWPASGVAGGVYDDAARAAGVRLLSVDKPGYGRSDHDPRRALPRYADDIGQLTDHLGLRRFVAVGESGGGPHALALAHRLPDRVLAALVLSGLAPPDANSDTDWRSRAHRSLLAVARAAPWTLRVHMLLYSRMLAHPAMARAWSRGLRWQATREDRRGWGTFDHSLLVAATADAFSQGHRAAVQEMTMFTQPWGFALSEIARPVEIWHGTADGTVPVTAARHIGDRIPRATTHLSRGNGHYLGPLYRHEIMRAVVQAASRIP